VFGKKIDTTESDDNSPFGYLKPNEVYLDSACQTLRPQPVIDAINEYYTCYNACGGRVKYKWGQQVDKLIEASREAVINFLGLSKKDYMCSFTLNTTYGVNLVLSQLPADYTQVITTEIEHNSVILPSIQLAKRLNIPRTILQRDDSGKVLYKPADFEKAVVVINAVSNIDGRALVNINELVKDAHQNGAIVVIDAAQTMAHHSDLLKGCPADAICFSGHKMYGASLGVIVIRKELVNKLQLSFVGGGMVASVTQKDYKLLPDMPETWLEPGLQAYAEIISLGAAIKWLGTQKFGGSTPKEYIRELSSQLFDGLIAIDSISLVNKQASPVISFYPNKGDAHRLAIFLSSAGIMARSGYFCCHYYLIETQKLPPLIRFSIGLHNTPADIDATLKAVAKFTKG
jgi:selenocysteine lyase/cysteine desulfurase